MWYAVAIRVELQNHPDPNPTHNPNLLNLHICSFSSGHARIVVFIFIRNKADPANVILTAYAACKTVCMTRTAVAAIKHVSRAIVLAESILITVILAEIVVG